MWTNKATVELLKRKIEKIIHRFSKENLNDFKGEDAEMFNEDVNFELDDPDRLGDAIYTHMKVSHVSSFSQIIAITMLAEGGSGILFTVFDKKN